jgi:DNA-binding MarR family transcriptional regulator
MGTSFEIIQKLVGWVDQFTQDQDKKEISIEDFLVWLNSRVFSDNHTHIDHHDKDQVNMELSFLLIMQNRHFKSYAKKALVDSALSSPDTFSFLYHLSLVDSYRKMELIRMHMLEAPSGIEVLKRLLAKGLIEEFDDPDDKRAKRIKISIKGKEELEASLPAMQQVFKQMTAEMSLSEKLHFISALRDINDYHVLHAKTFDIEKKG